MKTLSLALLTTMGVLALTTPAAAQRAGEESTVTTYVGIYGADEGFDDRWVVGNFTNVYSGDLGLHADVAYVNREQNGTFGAGGLSYAFSDRVRVKGTIGTSTNDQNILPELFLSGSIQLKPAKGLILTPDVTYRKYRSGGSEISPGVQVAKYFNIASDTGGYYVVQADTSLSFIEGADKTGWSVGVGGTTVRKSGWTFGTNARVGYMAYDTITGTGRLPVRSKTIGGGASVGYRIENGPEVFVRGNVAANDFFTVSGGMLGLKFTL